MQPQFTYLIFIHSGFSCEFQMSKTVQSFKAMNEHFLYIFGLPWIAYGYESRITVDVTNLLNNYLSAFYPSIKSCQAVPSFQVLHNKVVCHIANTITT